MGKAATASASHCKDFLRSALRLDYYALPDFGQMTDE
jgi:hypothetical protein